MGRHQSRETALQVLYQIEINKIEVNEALRLMKEEFSAEAKDFEYTSRIVNGVMEKINFLNSVIERVAIDWSMKRIAKVELSIMRIALFETFFVEDVPSSVAVNEALILAKAFSSDEASKFINGVLGKVVVNLEEYKNIKVN